MLPPFDVTGFVRGFDDLIDSVHRAQMGGEVLIDDATYRAAFEKIYAAYEQARRERIKAKASAQEMSPAQVSLGMQGVNAAARKAQRITEQRVVSDLIRVETDLAEILGKMHAAFVKGLAEDSARAADIRSAGA